MFPAPASPKRFVQDLEELGYDTGIVGAHFALYGLPYLDEAGGLQHGDLFSPVNFDADGVINGSDTHQCWWVGSRPFGRDRSDLGVGYADNPRLIVEGLTANTSFSLKLRDGDAPPRDYASFEEKMLTYLHVIVGPAMAAHPDATPLRGIERRAEEQGSPLRWPDTMSANYGINDIANRLRGKKVAIVGLGGTGSCILDFIARTHLENITLFDGDKVHVHTLFRIPGFLGKKVIGKPKVEVLAQVYDGWHAGITAVAERVTADNIEQLRGFDFVFVAVDDGPARGVLLDWLSNAGIPYVDCGMGLVRSYGSTLNGRVRVTGVDRAAYERTEGTMFLQTDNAKDHEYRKQAQIIELNALNAAWAVVRFKQHFGLYERVDEAAGYIFETASFEVSAGGPPQ
ncbi:ThiF family adenylyltransferase [Dokdonella sp.]|uniref:ThiF family adenylyltransferase n=1 Tax=Dokdonella sp. TaxID=2291710 RepID=UPI003783077B